MQYNNYAYKLHLTSSESECPFNDFVLYFEIICGTNE